MQRTPPRTPSLSQAGRSQSDSPGSRRAGSPAILFPPDGAVIEGTRLTVRVQDGQPPWTWLANGLPVATTHRPETQLPDLGPGFSALTVIDAAGRAASARVELR